MTDPRMYFLLLVALLVGLVAGAWVMAMCVAASRNDKEMGDGNKSVDRQISRLESVPPRKKPPQGPCRPYGKNDG